MNDKPSLTLRLAVGAFAATLVADPLAFAQSQPARTTEEVSAALASSKPAGAAFTQQDLDELLAPIALYPDSLLAQVLMASTYPLEVVEAARWQKQNSALKDKALEEALAKQSWDPSVKALAAVPQVLTMMNEKLDWTTKLGDAFLADQEKVLKTTQALRKKADEAGNLKTSKEMTVKKETENNVQVIKIENPTPETVYVPTYNPATAYGTWWYAAPPPYYYYPPGYVYGGAGLAFASGVFWGAAIAGGIGWNNNEININRNTNINTGNRNNIQGGDKWKHNPEHRKGASYRDNATASKYGKGSDSRAAQSREQYRGRAEQGRQNMASDRGEINRANERAGASNRAGSSSVSDRGGGGNFGGGDRGGGINSSNFGGGGDRGGGASSRGGSGGFSGAGGGGASTRAASSRGSASRGGGGGSRGGGGGRGGRR